MEFDKSRVYTAANADELKAGSIVCVADNLWVLKTRLSKGKSTKLSKIQSEGHQYRFCVGSCSFALAYLIGPPKLNRIAYLARSGDDCYLTSCMAEKWETAKSCCGAKSKLFVGTEEEVERWIKERKHLEPLIKAFEDGKKIQFYHTAYKSWKDVGIMLWDTNTRYRVKGEVLKWTDLNVGDIIRTKDGSETATVISMCKDSPDEHIIIANWLKDDDLGKYWEKKED